MGGRRQDHLWGAASVRHPDTHTLRPFQGLGVDFMTGRPRALNADEMGLGKTIQTICSLNELGARRVLIVCPATLKLNWVREYRIWGTLGRVVGYADGGFFPSVDVAIINYDILAKHLPEIQKRHWDVIVLDESHYIKTRSAKRSQAAGQLNADVKYALTGTPVLNRPIELWTTLWWLGSKIPYRDFAVKYCAGHDEQIFTPRGPINQFNDRGASNLDELASNLAPVMIRRLKSEVLPELPAKQRQVVQLGGSRLATKEGGLLKKLRRKDSLQPDTSSVDFERLVQADPVAMTELSTVRREAALAKVPQVIEYLKNALEQEDKVVCMAWHTDVIEQIHQAMADYGPTILTGSTPTNYRQMRVDQFQNEPDCRLFVGQMQAAGVGITLTAASHVVFAELDWVPGNVVQAEDRCHRIGQDRAVNITYLVVDGTVDSMLAHSLVRKQRVIDRVIRPTDQGELK